VDSYHHKLPTCIIRPGAILAAYEEPFPGWLEADSAISRYYRSVFDGFNFAPNIDPDVRTVITAVDYTVNLILAAAWKLGQSPKQGTVVYNNAKNAISWKDCIRTGAAEVRKNRYGSLTWYPNSSCERNAKLRLLKNFLFRTVPGFVYDSVLRRGNNGKSLLKTTQDYIALDQIFQPFVLNEWNLGSCQNTKALTKELSEDDRNTFPMDLDLIDWNEFIKRFAKGLHVFDPDEKEDGCASAAHMCKLRAIDLGMKLCVLLSMVSFGIALYHFGCVLWQ
jgi:fatty acyl-CoA reductase